MNMPALAHSGYCIALTMLCNVATIVCIAIMKFANAGIVNNANAVRIANDNHTVDFMFISLAH